MRSFRRRSVWFVLAVMTLPACGGPASPDSAQVLSNRLFESVESAGDSEAPVEAAEPLQVAFRNLSDGQRYEVESGNSRLDSDAVVLLAWTSGCNWHNKLFEVTDTQLRTIEAAEEAETSELMECGPQQADEEQEISEFFGDSVDWQLDETELVLSGNATHIRFEEIADAPG